MNIPYPPAQPKNKATAQRIFASQSLHNQATHTRVMARLHEAVADGALVLVQDDFTGNTLVTAGEKADALTSHLTGGEVENNLSILCDLVNDRRGSTSGRPYEPPAILAPAQDYAAMERVNTFRLMIENKGAAALAELRALRQANTPNYEEDLWGDAARNIFGETREFDEHPEYVRSVCQAFWRSIIARTCVDDERGADIHAVLCLLGAQGRSKSDFAKEVVGQDFHSDSLEMGGDAREEVSATQGIAVLEIAEQIGFDSKSQGRIKRDATASNRKVRVLYTMKGKRFPKRYVYVVTGNETQFLTDGTGGRRYLPLNVTGDIGITWLKDHRLALLAYAYEELREDIADANGGNFDGRRLQIREQCNLHRDHWALREALVKGHTIGNWLTEILVTAETEDCLFGEIVQHGGMLRRALTDLDIYKMATDAFDGGKTPHIGPKEISIAVASRDWTKEPCHARKCWRNGAWQDRDLREKGRVRHLAPVTGKSGGLPNLASLAKTA